MADETENKLKDDKITEDSDTTASNATSVEEMIEDENVVQEEIDPKQTELNEALARVSSLEDQLLRSQAEIQNMQQRHAREIQNVHKYDGQKLASAVLPAVDNLERALLVESEDAVAQQIKTGVEMTLKTLVQALTDNDISATGEVGETFDPTKHQAIQSVDSDDVDSDQIASVLQKGYILQDRVLRPAMVAVAK
ncbi:nucleotide exchange factor GrpE [Leuconostoc gelidum subsp. gasicomitatum]|uniref:nucleotide exchange factor GrpE n=1 Tax=Leuconostoc gasicomitatum TaxID=115778 RepID=UPI001CC599A3|nr:nucleotide exchange factor GrpE [Leuconostoc gasicomitatum]MBZ5993697.1 nucleotide exchange factor GrpE [Leuconostoc gasicomitatum]